MEALALDVRNFDVFLELTNSMMTAEEGPCCVYPSCPANGPLITYCMSEWHFIQHLGYREQLHSDDAAFVRLAYTARLHTVNIG